MHATEVKGECPRPPSLLLPSGQALRDDALSALHPRPTHTSLRALFSALFVF